MNSNSDYYSKTHLRFLFLLWAHLPLAGLTASLSGTDMILALGIAFFINAIPSFLVWSQRTSLLTSLSLGMATIFHSALLIYVSKGMTELHFHIFSAMGILIMLAEPWTVLAALGVVVVHHVGFFFFFPKALINYDAGLGILVIHALFALAIGIPAFFISRSFKTYIVGVKRLVGEIDSIAQELGDKSGEMKETATTLADSTQKEASAMEKTSSALEELKSMITSNSTNAAETLEQVEASRNSSVEGLEVMQKVVQALREIQQNNTFFVSSAESNQEKMREIAQSIKTIGEKTKVINEIVFQTKLLSFNASVEAARAGEHGKGFSVVAEEVGNLAVMSGKSAKEISDLLESSIKHVESIAQDTQKSTQKIVETGQTKIEAGVKIADECESLLKTINEKMESVGQRAQEIARASEEQSSGVSEITKAMHQVEQSSTTNQSVSVRANEVSVGLHEESHRLNSAIRSLSVALESGKLPASENRRTGS